MGGGYISFAARFERHHGLALGPRSENVSAGDHRGGDDAIPVIAFLIEAGTPDLGTVLGAVPADVVAADDN